jgi:hypothetical protein
MTHTPTHHRRHQAKGPAGTKACGPSWPKENQYSLRTNTLHRGITGALSQLGAPNAPNASIGDPLTVSFAKLLDLGRWFEAF